MNISPVSFKGVIKVTTRENRDSAPKTEYYRTTKKQDGEILNAAVQTMENIASKPYEYGEKPVYGKDTLVLHKTIEKFTGKELPKNLNDSKILLMGGSNDSSYFKMDKYNSGYNKIYYTDRFVLENRPSGRVTIDLMEPEERLAAAKETLGGIQTRISKMTGKDKDLRLNPNLVDGSKCHEGEYSKMEEVLNKTLFYLDGNIDGPQSEHLPVFESSKQAYDTLIDSITKITQSDEPVSKYTDPAYPVLNQKNMNNIRRAVYYLQSV